MNYFPGSLVSGPVLQFPPPPPPPLSGGEGGSSTTASTSSHGGTSNTGSRGAPSRGGSSQHLFMQHLPYHPTGGSNSGTSYHTSPLLHQRQQIRNQVSPNQAIPSNQLNNSSGSNNSHQYQQQPQQHYHISQPISPGYTQCQQPVDPFEQAKNIIHENRPGMESWLNNGVPENGFLASSGYTSRRCPSPQSSALGDAEESDDKECEEDSCWSEGGTNEASSGGSVSSLNPDLNWTEAVRLMSENKWPNDQINGQTSVPHGLEQFLKGKEKTDHIPEKLCYPKNEDPEVDRLLSGQAPDKISADKNIDNSSSNYYCQMPSDGGKQVKHSKRSSDRSPGATKLPSNNRNYNNGNEPTIELNCGRNKLSNHSRKTSLTSPLV